MSTASTYVFDQTDLRGNFTYTNVANFETPFIETRQNTLSGSFLNVGRPNREVTVDLFTTFNASNFLFLIDTAPLIDNVSHSPNPNALLFQLASLMNHFAYRKDDVRAGWIPWQFVPYHDNAPTRHQDSDLINQIAFNFHIDRGVGTTDNDGWIAVYFVFFLDSEGRLGASVDGWAYEFGGGEGLTDDAPDLARVIDTLVPTFVPAIQSFLNSFCAGAAVSAGGMHDINGRAIFDGFYLLPGDGNTNYGPSDVTGSLSLFTGNGARSVDAEVTLALLPRPKVVARIGLYGRLVAAELSSVLKKNRWKLLISESSGTYHLIGSRSSKEGNMEIKVCLREMPVKISGAAAVRDESRTFAKKSKKK